MTDLAGATSAGTVSQGTHPIRFWPNRANWPIWALTAGMPFVFFVGMHGLIWPLVAVVLTLRVLTHRESRFPWLTAPLFVFVGWALLSYAAAPASSLPIFIYRWLLFLGTLATCVWVANIHRQKVSSEQVVNWLSWLWIWTIAFGYVAQVFPAFSMASPTTTLLGPLGRVDFVARISDWHLADRNEFADTLFARPAAPWAAANSWGAAIGMLTPFFVQAWLLDVPKKRRRIGYLLLAASAIPILMSANRGLWIGLSVAFVYFTMRRALKGKYSAVIILLIGTAMIAVILVATPAGNLVQNRFAGSDGSNESRSQLYVDAWKGALDSPLVGNGVPRETHYFKNSPPVGTHGLLWYLMFIHGFVGMVLFLGWLISEVFNSGRIKTPLAWSFHMCLVITLIEVPYYGLQPHVMIAGLAAGMVHRERMQPQSTASVSDSDQVRLSRTS